MKDFIHDGSVVNLPNNALDYNTPRKRDHLLSQKKSHNFELIMGTTRRKFSSAFKARVALEALKERETLSELSTRFK